MAATIPLPTTDESVFSSDPASSTDLSSLRAAAAAGVPSATSSMSMAMAQSQPSPSPPPSIRMSFILFIIGCNDN
jgi:hypothetical protein